MKTKKGFTLIELLVVIAIIAILAAILFPVFSKVRDKARQIADLSNTKQISLGLLQYIEDYDEHVVLNNNGSGNGWSADRYGESGSGYWQDWEALLMPYIKSTGENGVYHSPGGSAASGDYWDASFDLVDLPTPPGSFVSSLTLNNVYFDDPNLGNLYNNTGAQISKISDPADMIFCADGGAGSGTYSYGPANNYGGGGPEQLYYYPEQVSNDWALYGSSMPAGGLQYLNASQAQYPQLDSLYQGDFIGHFSGGMNCAFFDGHAKFMQVSTLGKVYPCPSGFSDSGAGSQDMCASGGVLPYFTTQADTFLK